MTIPNKIHTNANQISSKRSLSSVLLDYFILIKPSIILLLLITTVPAMILASKPGSLPSINLILATLLGGILAAGGAGSVNMYIDRDIDKIMSRTLSRPVPSERVSAKSALTLGIIMAIAAGVWLELSVNTFTAILSVSAFLYYIIIYSLLLKRYTVHNTVLGGIAGAAPPLIGWVAVTGEIGWVGIILFIVVFTWQPAHFWALALGLAEDYKKAGIPMLPVVRSETETKGQTLAWSMLTFVVTMGLGIAAELGTIYFIVAIIGGGGFIYVCWQLFRTPGITKAPLVFRYSTIYLAVLFAAIALDRILII